MVLVYSLGLHLGAVFLDHPHSFNLWRWKDRDDLSTGGGGGSFTPIAGGQKRCTGIDLSR
jgi:cytochrome P450